MSGEDNMNIIVMCHVLNIHMRRIIMFDKHYSKIKSKQGKRYFLQLCSLNIYMCLWLNIFYRIFAKNKRKHLNCN